MDRYFENDFYDEDEVVLVPPYYVVIYVDDYGYKHIATVKDEVYLAYLKQRFIILECKIVEK